MTDAEMIQLLKDLLPLLIPVYIIQFGICLYAIGDLRKRSKVRGSKTAWTILLVLAALSVPTGLIVVTIYLLWGRNQEEYNDQD